MPRFGSASLAKLSTCHEEIRAVCNAVIPGYDHTIIWGRRDKDQQNILYPIYTTKLWPESNHNTEEPDGLVDAVDIAPWHATKPHIRWESEREFIYLAGHMMQAARALGVNLRYGGDWDRDQDLYDFNKPFDLGHFERIG